MAKGERGVLRNMANRERMRDNALRMIEGESTPWEAARATRKARRASDPRVQARARQWASQRSQEPSWLFRQE